MTDVIIAAEDGVPIPERTESSEATPTSASVPGDLTHRMSVQERGAWEDQTGNEEKVGDKNREEDGDDDHYYYCDGNDDDDPECWSPSSPRPPRSMPQDIGSAIPGFRMSVAQESASPVRGRTSGKRGETDTAAAGGGDDDSDAALEASLRDALRRISSTPGGAAFADALEQTARVDDSTSPPVLVPLGAAATGAVADVKEADANGDADVHAVVRASGDTTTDADADAGESAAATARPESSPAKATPPAPKPATPERSAKPPARPTPEATRPAEGARATRWKQAFPGLRTHAATRRRVSATVSVSPCEVNGRARPRRLHQRRRGTREMDRGGETSAAPGSPCPPPAPDSESRLPPAGRAPGRVRAIVEAEAIGVVPFAEDDDSFLSEAPDLVGANEEVAAVAGRSHDEIAVLPHPAFGRRGSLASPRHPLQPRASIEARTATTAATPTTNAPTEAASEASATARGPSTDPRARIEEKDPTDGETRVAVDAAAGADRWPTPPASDPRPAERPGSGDEEDQARRMAETAYEPLQETSALLRRECRVDRVAREIALTLRHLDGRDPDEVFASRHRVLWALLPRLARVPGATPLARRLTERLVSVAASRRGGVRELALDPDYIPAALVTAVERSIRAHQRLARRLREVEAAAAFTYETEKACIERETLLQEVGDSEDNEDGRSA